MASDKAVALECHTCGKLREKDVDYLCMGDGSELSIQAVCNKCENTIQVETKSDSNPLTCETSTGYAAEMPCGKGSACLQPQGTSSGGYHMPRSQSEYQMSGQKQQRHLARSHCAVDDTVWGLRSTSIDNGDLSREELKQRRAMYCEKLSCRRCPVGSSMLVPIDDVKDVFICLNCEDVTGLDDSISYYDLMKELNEEKYRVEPCFKCGNDDPYRFTLELEGSYDDGPVVLFLKCTSCSTPQLNSKEYWLSPDVNKSDAVPLHEIGSEAMRKEERSSEKTEMCICGTTRAPEVVYDENGSVVKVVCRQCAMEMVCEAQSPALSTEENRAPVGRTQIKSLSQLSMGDHIAWHKNLGYWHHAILLEVNGLQIRVINYNGPSVNKGKVVEESIPVDPDKEQLYRIDYQPAHCYDPDDVVARAYSKLGECSYNLLCNNCEHFASWCKTGQKSSSQTKSFTNSLMQRAKYLTSFIPVPSYQTVMKHGLKAISRQQGDVASAGTKGLLVKEGSALTSNLAPLLVVGHEVMMVCKDVHRAHQQRVAGEITRHEFIKITIKRTSEGCGSLAGVAIAVAIPFTRNSSVGRTLGAIIGQGVGAVVGRHLCALADRKSTSGTECS